MKYKIIVILFLIFTIFTINERVVYADTYADVIKEVTNAYYRKGIKIQYDDYRKGLFSPEAATADSTSYMVCSYFPRNIYSEAFGIVLPSGTGALLSVGNFNYKQGKKYSDVVLGYNAKSADDGLNNSITNFFSVKKVSNYKTFIDKFAGSRDLAVGDIISYSWIIGNDIYGQGHTIMVYDLIKVNDVVVDAIIMEVAGTNINSEEENVENIKQSSSIDSIKASYGIPTITQGAIRAHRLSSYLTENIYNNLIVKGGKKITAFTVIRPLGFDPSTKEFSDTVENNYSISSTTSVNSNGDRIYTGNIKEENKKIEMPKSSLFRINNKGLDVEKTSDKHFAYVYNGQIITYSIKLKNYSNSNINGLDISETLSGNVSFRECDLNCLNNDNKIVWNNISIKPGEILTLTYKVTVRGTGTVIAKGNVCSSFSNDYCINTTSIENEIVDSSLGTNIKQIIENVNSTSYRDKYGLDYINNIYSNIINTNLIEKRNLSSYLGFNDLDFKDNTSLYLYQTKYRSSWGKSLYTSRGKHNMIAPLLNNLTTGDVIWAVNQDVIPCTAASTCKEKVGSEFQYLFVMAKINNINTNTLIRNEESGLVVITKNGKFQCITSSNDCDINRIMLDVSIGNISNGWKKIDQSTTFKVLENLPAKYAYAVFSPEKYVKKESLSVKEETKQNKDSKAEKGGILVSCRPKASNVNSCKIVLEEESSFAQLDLSFDRLKKEDISNISFSKDWGVAFEDNKITIVKNDQEQNAKSDSVIVTFDVKPNNDDSISINDVVEYDVDGNEYMDLSTKIENNMQNDIKNKAESSKTIVYAIISAILAGIVIIFILVVTKKKSLMNK